MPLCLCGLAVAQPLNAGKYFTIKVADEQTGRGVPLVELTTVHNVRYYTDSNGVIAFYEPGLMNTEVYFHVKSPGYEYPKDGFGYSGRALQVTEGGQAEVKIKRFNIAERLYRVTGGGIYRDSVLLRLPVPVAEPVLNGLVLGSDSVLNTVYQGKLYWFWGDTNRVAYPLGNFHASGATSRLPGEGGLDPEVGVDLTYFLEEKGFAKRMASVGTDGATWLDGLVTLRDAAGREHMLAAYARVRSLSDCFERGLAEFNDEQQVFEKVAQFDVNAPVYPGGHPIGLAVNGGEYCYFARAFPLTRVRADREHYIDASACESFTCLKEGTRVEATQLDRDPGGAVRYAWRRNTPALGPKEQADLVKAGHLKPEEALLQIQDPETGKPVAIHNGSVYWNRYRGRWVMIAVEAFGTSMLGEVWYAEADTPVGPWVYARKIVTHDTYSFYNPKQHPEFDKDNGRIIFFEGTYSQTFSGSPIPTPLYDYNQIMYKLDLADPRLILPVPVYDLSEDGVPGRFATLDQVPPARPAPPVAFFACDRLAPRTVPLHATAGAERVFRLTSGSPAGTPSAAAPAPVFYAFPAGSGPTAGTAVPLYEFVDTEHGRYAYSADAAWSRPGYQRAEQPVCYVWRNPLAPTLRFALHQALPR